MEGIPEAPAGEGVAARRPGADLRAWPRAGWVLLQEFSGACADLFPGWKKFPKDFVETSSFRPPVGFCCHRYALKPVPP